MQHLCSKCVVSTLHQFKQVERVQFDVAVVVKSHAEVGSLLPGVAAFLWRQDVLGGVEHFLVRGLGAADMVREGVVRDLRSKHFMAKDTVL